ncbi:MAG: PIN domain-containing protein [Defluviitaleaceae bacterium]|nr:PIN domain-containing protein [Defluviitaleaceae bacterium]
MVLVDTSVLIDFFKGTTNESVELFEKILDKKIPFAISILTYQEILQGARNEKEFDMLKSYLSTQNILMLPNNNLDFFNKASWIRYSLREKGITIRNTVDLLIAMTALHHKCSLLQNDKDFKYIAEECKELQFFVGFAHTSSGQSETHGFMT